MSGSVGRVWWSDAEWAMLSDERTCGMCADAHLDENQHSLRVASTATTHVRLVRNQAHPGYCVVILRAHETDLAELGQADLTAFWTDVQRAGRAIATVVEPCKIDYFVMGHRMPHLHCHVFPQHTRDDPRRNVDISDGPKFPSPAELRERALLLRNAWLAAG